MNDPAQPPDVGAACARWHARLAGEHGDPGALARLRRAHGPMDVLLVEAYHALRAELPHAATDRLTLVAAVLAHVKRDDPSRPLGRQLAGAGHAAPVNPRRFRNLLSASREWPGVQREFTRTVKLLDHTVNVRDLARSLYVWDEATRRRLALDYFENAPTPKEE